MKFFLALIVFAAGGFFYLFLISSAFRIEQVAVSGNKNISEKNIRQTIDEYLNRRFLFFWRPRNIVLAKSEEIYRKILNEYIFIGDVSVMKKYFHKINIVIKEREIFAIWCKVVIRKQNENTNETTANEINKDLLIIKSVEIAEEFIATDECYYIDDTGIIFSEAPQSSGSLILRIDEVYDEDVKIGDKILNNGIITSIATVQKYFNMDNLKIARFFIKNLATPDLEILTSEDWKIYLDRDKDIKNQMEILGKVLREKITLSERKNLEYIDLKIPDRVYYR
ncbi:MAG: FtsQ-type POTRA domain-containing protein [Patescibacteria group bacterium]